MDREDDHGKEVEDEEEICKEGRSGAQEEENDEIGGEEGPEENCKEGVEGHKVTKKAAPKRKAPVKKPAPMPAAEPAPAPSSPSLLGSLFSGGGSESGTT